MVKVEGTEQSRCRVLKPCYEWGSQSAGAQRAEPLSLP
jgi:hypothetical protein